MTHVFKNNDYESTHATHVFKNNDYKSTHATHVFKNNDYESNLATHLKNKNDYESTHHATLFFKTTMNRLRRLLTRIGATSATASYGYALK